MALTEWGGETTPGNWGPRWADGLHRNGATTTGRAGAYQKMGQPASPDLASYNRAALVPLQSTKRCG